MSCCRGLSGTVDITELVQAINSGVLHPQYRDDLYWSPPHLAPGQREPVPPMFVLDDSTAGQIASLLGASVVREPAVSEGLTHSPDVPMIQFPDGGILNASGVALVFKPCDSCPAFPVTPQQAIDGLSSSSFWFRRAPEGTQFVSGPVSTLSQAQQDAVNSGYIQGTPVTTPSVYVAPLVHTAPPPVYNPPVVYSAPPAVTPQNDAYGQASGSHIVPNPQTTGETQQQTASAASSLTAIFTGSDFFGLPNWVWFAGGAAALFLLVGGKK